MVIEVKHAHKKIVRGEEKEEIRRGYKVGQVKELSGKRKNSLYKALNKSVPNLREPYDSHLAKIVLEDRYLKRDSKGNMLENTKDCYMRVARTLASVDAQYGATLKQCRENFERYYDLMASKDFMPNSPTLMNAGFPLGQLSACFVLPVEDSIDSILESVKRTGLIHKSGGGTGFNFGKIRPVDYFVSTTYGKASGPLSFIGIFNEATDAINQGGFRRGANMAIFPCYHPDIMKFVDAKTDLSSFQNFNFSVGITDEFIEAYRNDGYYDTINPMDGSVVGRLKAREVFKRVIDNAHRYGEPGVILLDRINRDNPTPNLGIIDSTNPCGEQPLLPNEACNLGSINLPNFLDLKRRSFDYNRLEDVVESATRFLDNVIDANVLPFPEIAEAMAWTRKIGLGVMGFADVAALLGYPYDSQEAAELGEKIMKKVTTKARETSEKIAEDRGNFSAYEGSIYDKGKKSKPMRNSTRTTIAPTGTISLICNGVSSGIEPPFSITQQRKITGSDRMLQYFNKGFEIAMQERGIDPQEYWEAIKDNDGRLEGVKGIPKELVKVFKIGKDLDVKAHLDVQRGFQKYTDNAVSKTLNFMEGSSKDDIRKVYETIFDDPIIKGVTVYVEGSREDVITSGKKKLPKLVWNDLQAPKVLKTKRVHDGFKVKVGLEDNIHLSVSSGVCKHKETGQYYLWPYEIFQNRLPIGDQESIEFSQQGMERSMMMKNPGTDLVKWIRSMKSVRSSEFGLGENKSFGLSHSAGVALEYVLRRQGIVGEDENGKLAQLVSLGDLKEIKDEKEIEEVLSERFGSIEKETYDVTKNRDSKDLCPVCKKKLLHQEGCYGGRCPDGCWDSCN